MKSPRGSRLQRIGKVNLLAESQRKLRHEHLPQALKRALLHRPGTAPATTSSAKCKKSRSIAGRSRRSVGERNRARRAESGGRARFATCRRRAARAVASFAVMIARNSTEGARSTARRASLCPSGRNSSGSPRYICRRVLKINTIRRDARFSDGPKSRKFRLNSSRACPECRIRHRCATHSNLRLGRQQ